MTNMPEKDAVPDKGVESVQYSVTEIQELDTSRPVSSGSGSESEQWQPGFWRRFPWLGAGAMFFVILVTLLQVFILVLSNEKATSQWNKPVIRYSKAKWPAPNVVLSMLNSLVSIGFTVAVGQGIAIAWWRKALRGTSIKELHNTWSFGGSISAILLNLKYFNFAALAAVVTKLTIIDGVLFQRATTTYTALGPQTTHNITTYPTLSLPPTAFYNEFVNDTSIITDDFGWDVGSWINSAYGSVRSTYGYLDCEGVCAMNVSQPGYLATCYRTQEDVDLLANHPTANGSVAVTNIFEISVNLTLNTPEKNYTWIGLNYTDYSPQERDYSNTTARCPAIMYKTQCELRQSIITYPVYMERSNIATKSPKNTVSNVDVYLGGIDLENGTYVDPGSFNYTTGQVSNFIWDSWVIKHSVVDFEPFGSTDDGGIYDALKSQFSSQAHVKTNATEGFWSLETDGTYASLEQGSTDNTGLTYDNYTCPTIFNDPSTDIMIRLNQLTFIAADDIYIRPEYTDVNLTDAETAAYPNNSRVFQEAIQFVPEIHYKTNFGFMFGALGSTAFCILLVLPVYWGFWELGRPVSLNPIEIASAFQAPMLVPVQPKTGHADDLVKVAGPYQLKYANVAEGSDGKRLRFVSSTTQSATRQDV